jgi:hypothetical protein
MKKLLLSVFFSLLCSEAWPQKNSLLTWITGTWKIKTSNGGTIVESWVQVNDSTFHGSSVWVKATGDTIPQEALQLVNRANQWLYIPTVNSQNNNQPVPFKVIFIGKNEFISENPSHDFPQRISYRRLGTQMFASIEGNAKGKYSKQNFDFTKVE